MNFSGTVFASFNTQKDANHFKHHLEKNGINFLINYIVSSSKSPSDFTVKDLVVSDASEPSDISWEDLEFSEGEHMKRSLIIHLLSVLMIVLSLIVLTLISVFQRNYTSSGIMTYVVSLVFSTVVSTFNWAIGKTLIVITG